VSCLLYYNTRACIILEPLASGVVATIVLFFDVRVFNAFAESNQSSSLAAIFRRHEGEKHRAYEEKWKGAVSHLLCSPLLGTWGKLPQLLIIALPPFLVTNGSPPTL